MEKSPEAFRTISEVADFLETPAHVLRFWESRFPQIRPVKRAGGRRYYRPGDVALLSGIKRLLHDEGMTIRGVQKILREQGIRYVAGLSPAGSEAPSDEPDIEAVLAAEFGTATAEEPDEPSTAQTAQIISLERALARQEQPGPDPAAATWPEAEGDDPPALTPNWPQDPEDTAEAPFTEAEPDESEAEVAAYPDAAENLEPDQTVADLPEAQPVPSAGDSDGPDAEDDSSAESGDDATVAALIRRLPQGAVTHRQEALRALHRRAYDLRERLAEAARRRAR